MRVFTQNIKLVTLMLLAIIVWSCKDEKLEALEKKTQEATCKTEFMLSLIDNSENTIVLGNQLGLEHEYEAYLKVQADTSATCKEVRNKWSEYSDLVYKKSL